MQISILSMLIGPFARFTLGKQTVWTTICEKNSCLTYTKGSITAVYSQLMSIKGMWFNVHFYLIMRLSVVWRTYWPRVKCVMGSSCPTFWWHMVPSRRQMVHHKIDPYVCHGQSKYHESVISWNGESYLKIVSASMWVKLKWWVTFYDGGCVMVHKRMTHIWTMTHHSWGLICASYNWQLHNCYPSPFPIFQCWKFVRDGPQQAHSNIAIGKGDWQAK